ncbi:hypothetical protein ACIQUZ_33080 [Streptomyces griseus]|uniref:hypothetical protein n=1 Tax=Streptomyces griseus TaxID=1911 RepID=UPI0038296F1E
MASRGQLEFPGFAPEVPDLTRYRWILANLSGGKDSQAMLVELMRHARAPGVVDRIVVVHADLGDAEWEGAVEPAAEHAAFYRLRFEVVARTGGGVIDRIEERGMFPSADNRWCTSDFKRGPVRPGPHLFDQRCMGGRPPLRAAHPARPGRPVDRP